MRRRGGNDDDLSCKGLCCFRSSKTQTQHYFDNPKKKKKSSLVNSCSLHDSEEKQQPVCNHLGFFGLFGLCTTMFTGGDPTLSLSRRSMLRQIGSDSPAEVMGATRSKALFHTCSILACLIFSVSQSLCPQRGVVMQLFGGGKTNTTTRECMHV